MATRTGESVSEPTSRKISQVNEDSDNSGQEKSLNKLLVEAKKQLEIEKEAMKRKVCWGERDLIIVNYLLEHYIILLQIDY